MPVTIQDIAKDLGLSHTTVSRVLNSRDRELISEGTRLRVRQAAQRMGYRPNRMARALVSGRSYLIEFLVQHVHPAYYSRTIQSLKQELRDSPYQIHILETGGWTPQQWAAGSTWPAEGILVLEEPDGLRHLLAEGLALPPLVSLGGSYLPDVDHVGVDLYSGAVSAVEHLWESGRRRIAFVLPSISTANARLDGYTAAIEARNENPEIIDILIAPGETTRASARQGVARYVKAKGAPDALLCFNDEMAIGAMRGLKDSGLRIPGDVAVVGCDGIEDAEYQDPPLSTLVIPYTKMASIAWEFLQRRIETPGLPLQSKVLMPELALRASSESRRG